VALRHWLLALAVGALVATTVGGTGAVSSASLDRGMAVTVAPPEDAYLGLGEPPVEPLPAPDTQVTLFQVTNRFGVTLNDLVVTVTETDPDAGPSVTTIAAASPLGPGDSTPVTADITCDTVGTEAVTVSLTATGDGIRIEGASRTVKLACTSDGDADEEDDDAGDDDGDEESDDGDDGGDDDGD
jgi:hypothetical protein